MIDPEVTAWCPRGDHADSGLLRCFGGADGVASGAALCFGWAAWRWGGGHPGRVLGWSPGGRKGCQRMIEGQLADSTGGRRPVIWFPTYCCAPAEHLPASSNPAFPHPPIIRRAAATRSATSPVVRTRARSPWRRTG